MPKEYKPDTVVLITAPEEFAPNAELLMNTIHEAFDPEKFQIVVMFNKDVKYITAEWINRPVLVQSEQEFDRLIGEFEAIQDSIESKRTQLVEEWEKNDG